MSQTPCPRCRRDTTDGLLCPTCISTYKRARKDLARFTPELRVVWLRLDQVAKGTIHRDDRSLELAQEDASVANAVPARLRTRDSQIALPATALPVDMDAGQLYQRATSWLRWTPTDQALLRGRLDAADLVDQTRRLARQVENAIDRREPELYLGTCDTPDLIDVDTALTVHPETGGDVITFNVEASTRLCGAHLYGRVGDTIVTCQACGYEYRIEERRAAMLAAVRDLLERPKVIADALTSLDMPVTAKTLDVWISRDKRMHQQGRARPDGLPLILADPVYDHDNKPLYRVGTIIDRVEAVRARTEQTG